ATALPASAQTDLEDVELLFRPRCRPDLPAVEPLLQSPDDGLLGGSRTKGLVDATGGGAEQHVAQLKQSDLRRRQRLDVGDRGGEVGIVQAALEVVQSLPVPVSLQ